MLALAGLTGKHVRATSLATFHAEDTPASSVGRGGGPSHQSPCLAWLKTLNISHPLGVRWGGGLIPACWLEKLPVSFLSNSIPLGPKKMRKGECGESSVG